MTIAQTNSAKRESHFAHRFCCAALPVTFESSHVTAVVDSREQTPLDLAAQQCH
jgi:hypothetical protein